jgi:hypothetical protein
LSPARRSLFVAAQVAFAVAVVWFAGDRLAGQWGDLRGARLAADVRWGPIFAASAIVLVTYALLIQTWRAVLGAWGARLSFWDAARITSVSNLGRYIPGKIWQITAMGVMAQRRGVPPVAATGSAILTSLVSVLTGVGLVLATGTGVLHFSAGAIAALAVLGASVTLAPVLIPKLMSLASAVVGRPMTLLRVPARSLWIAALGSLCAWVLYGMAFRLLAEGLLGRAAGAWEAYIAVYTGSYLAGFLALFAPGGLVVRESVMVLGLTQLGLATSSEALVLAVASRLWLTILEVVPGLLFLARDGARHLSKTSRNAPS